MTKKIKENNIISFYIIQSEIQYFEKILLRMALKLQL